MSKSTRSSPSCWLIGASQNQFSTARLPSRLDVLRVCQHFHLDQGLPLRLSFGKTIEGLLYVWERARIPTQRKDSCVRKLEALFKEYQAVQKVRTISLQSCRDREQEFLESLKNLFDVGAKDALQKINSEEDRTFYSLQRQNVTLCCMAGEDRNQSEKEQRKRNREAQEASRKSRYKMEAEAYKKNTDYSLISSSEDSESTDDTSPLRVTPVQKKSRTKNIFSNPEVASAMDRVNISDRGAAYVAGAVAQALGHDLENLTFSRSSIRRSRRSARVVAASLDQGVPDDDALLLHWDGKLLPDFSGNQRIVDRVAILISGDQKEKLLCVPKLERGTGSEQATACLSALDEWSLREQVQGLVFDTTAANTGLQRGACVLIEKGLGRELIWLACRHHVYEIVLTSVFRAIFGPSSGPNTDIFKRFKESWLNIDTKEYKAPDDEFFVEIGQSEARSNSLNYLRMAIKRDKQPRSDYKELLELCIVFLGGGDEHTKFKRPGATHQARFMGKAIYCLKIDLFQGQFKLTSRESKAIRSMSLFVALIYSRFWNESSVTTKAPLNDISFLQALETYSDRAVAEPAVKSFRRHLWYLSEPLVGLAFFDDRVDDAVKVKMVENLNKTKLREYPRRKETSEHEIPDLADCVTKRTENVFNLFKDRSAKEKAKATFLRHPPSTWVQDPVYRQLQVAASNVSCVNDAAERAVALIQTFNMSLTRDEEQKQYLLRLVAEHRRLLPEPSKAALKAKV